MPQFEFSLVLSGIDPDEAAFEDRFYEAGCDDALVSVVKGCVVLDFTREAKNFAHAIGSAIEEVRKCGASVVRIEPDSYATLGDMAERAGMTRQAMSLIVQGKRGPGNFPTPVARVSSESPLWDWLLVSRWLCRNDRLPGRRAVVQAALTRELNLMLEAQSEASKSSRSFSVLWQTIGRVPGPDAKAAGASR